ncbi:MAG TPA: hypothetical protein VMU62_00915 [Acidobacteriaceae bacterium]|nr:hypothetical protein [Acidobacteriaceae bacterium]
MMAVTLIVAAAIPAFAESKSTAEAPTQMVVTVVDHGHDPTQKSSIQQSIVKIKEDGKPAQVLDWKSVTAPENTQLVILIDDALQARSSANFTQLQKFILQLPATTQVAVGYMQYGRASIVSGFAANREMAAKSIRVPTGIAGVNASPYFCLSDLAKHWPDQGRQAAVRQVLMITDGVDRYFSAGAYDPEDPYVGTAIKDTQANRIIVSSIYFRDIGAVDRGIRGSFVGGSYLTQVAEATGGKMYNEGFGNPVTFVPLLADFSQRLADTYVVTFLAHGSGLQYIKISSEEHGIKLEAPNEVTVGQQLPKGSQITAGPRASESL